MSAACSSSSHHARQPKLSCSQLMTQQRSSTGWCAAARHAASKQQSSCTTLPPLLTVLCLQSCYASCAYWHTHALQQPHSTWPCQVRETLWQRLQHRHTRILQASSRAVQTHHYCSFFLAALPVRCRTVAVSDDYVELQYLDMQVSHICLQEQPAGCVRPSCCE